MKKNQNGFGVVGILLIIIVVGFLVGAGWYVVQRNYDKEQSESSEQTIKTASYTVSSGSAQMKELIESPGVLESN